MSVVRGFGLNGKSYYTNITQPQEVHLQFTVNSTDSDGYGITVNSLKSNGYVSAVFMHTAETPGKIGPHTNPNPPAGYALIILKNNFNHFIDLETVKLPPLQNTSTTSVSANSVYTLTSLGTATTAQLDAYGLPAGFTAAVGQTFVATASGTLPGSATVGTPGVPVTLATTIVGTPDALISNNTIATNDGAQLIVQFSAPTAGGAGDAYDLVTNVPTAPADGTVIAMSILFDRSTVGIPDTPGAGQL